MKYRLAVFDMDGTILDTLEDLKNSTNHALNVNGMPLRSLEEVRRFVGNGVYKLIKRAVPSGTSKETTDKVFADFKEYYADHSADETKPYDGIIEVIKQLKSQGVHVAVVSNKIEFAVKNLCDDYFLGIFELAAGDREGRRLKPYPDSVNWVIENFGADKSETVYIGDSDVDFETSQNAEVDFIGASWGFRGAEFLKDLGADKIAYKCTDILAFFE